MNSKLRVLMVNRADSYKAHGGDVIQMEQTQRALERLGVCVTVCLTNELTECKWDCDLVHLFNIHTADESYRAAQEVKDRGLPLVLSPIYWDPLPSWFGQVSKGKSIWRTVASGLGYRAGYWVYEHWQHLRYPQQCTWQTQRKLLELADALLPNSRAEMMQIFSDFRLTAQAFDFVSIVPNAVDRHLYNPKPSPSEELRQELGAQRIVLEVGRVSPEKNTLALIEALWDVDVMIVFAGRPSPYDSGYVTACHQRGAARGNVRFLDWIPHEKLPNLYALASVHALPSWRETPGLASLEAAASGCKVVSTCIGSAREYFGDDAWYCDPADKESIRKAVLSALNAPPNLLRQRVLENYTWDVAAGATLHCYKELLGL